MGHEGNLGHPDQLEALEFLEEQVALELQDILATWDLLDLQDLLELQANPDQMDHKDARDHQVAARVHLDQRETQDPEGHLVEKLDDLAHLELGVTWGLQDSRDIKVAEALQVHQGDLAGQVPLDQQVCMDHLDLWALEVALESVDHKVQMADLQDHQVQKAGEGQKGNQVQRMV